MRVRHAALCLIAASAIAGGSVRAQAPAPAQAPTPAETPPPAPVQAVAPDSARAAPPIMTSMARASWLSNRPLLQVGDIVTVILDEQTSARERTSKVATANRGQRASFSADADGESVVGATGFRTGMETGSNAQGEANRQGDLTGILSARIVSLSANGVARIEGVKKVTIDGREQEISLSGSIRLEDLAPSNVIYSSRIADASISYKGKDVGPRLGILGKIIGIIWP